ncbi:MAG: hypothetical protein ACO1RX_07280 [Candidatus Sericytochromatia bacterium]
MNPLQNRTVTPGQTAPGGPQPGVPDLILDGPRSRPAQAQPGAAPAAAPYQAPEQAIVQHSAQNLTQALMEMNLPPTQQNLQTAQLLANYGHAVNSQTLGIVRQAMAGLSDRSPATLEAVVILLTRDLPVNEQTVTAIKQFMNGQPLPQQLQNLPKDMGQLLQQLQQTAQSGAPVAAQTLAPAQGGLAPAQGATPAALPPAAAQAPAAAPVPGSAPGSALAASPAAGAPAGPAATPAAVPGAPVTPAAPGTPGVPNPAQLAQQAPQQLAQSIQSGQAQIQAAPVAGVVQQAAGQAQVVESRVDGPARVGGERSTAEKISQTAAGQNLQALEAATAPGKPAPSTPQLQQPLPMQQRDQQSLQQLNLMLQGGEIPTVDKVTAGGHAAQLSPEEAIYQLLRVIQDLGRVAGHLAENMQLRDVGQLFIQHQQIMQLTGLLEQRLQEFHQLFGKAFPGLAQDVQQLLQHDSLDMFSKLAQLLDDNQHALQEQLRLQGSPEEQNQVLSTLRQLMEQVGLQVEKIQAHLVAREMLSQNLPVHVVPIMVHMHGEAYPAEIYVQQDYDPQDSRSGPDGERPLKITLTLETQNMGRVSVDLATLKQDMNLDLQVQTRRVKLLVDERLEGLQRKIEGNGDYQLSRINCRVVPDLESRQSMLLPAKREVRSLRRVEGVV